jgi:hypothetical protein
MFGQRGLADPWLPSDQNQAPSTANRIFEPGCQLRQLPVPAEERPTSSIPYLAPHRAIVPPTGSAQRFRGRAMKR